MAYFDGIKAGDRVYDMRWGLGVLLSVGSDEFPLRVLFDDGEYDTFTMDGAYISGIGQTLFWSKPEFTPPPRPKRRVEKTIERWAAIPRGDPPRDISSLLNRGAINMKKYFVGESCEKIKKICEAYNIRDEECIVIKIICTYEVEE